MADFTRDDLRHDMRVAFKEVLTDKELLERVFEPHISRIVLEKITDKFERTLGVVCTDPESREETRKTIEFAHKSRVVAESPEGDERRKDMEFVRKVRQWSETEEGASSLAAFKRLMKVVDFAASSAVRGIIYLLLAGAVTLVAVGAATHKSVRAVFGL